MFGFIRGRLAPTQGPTSPQPTDTLRDHKTELDVYHYSPAAPFFLGTVECNELVSSIGTDPDVPLHLRSQQTLQTGRVPQISAWGSSVGADVAPYTDSPPPDFY
jgi:hypothetical protein